VDTSNITGAEGYRMIEFLEITNFRCFEHVELHQLRPVNIIVGENGSGKTAFLESLYLTLGLPALAFKLQNWRGMGVQAQYSETAASQSAIWRDLFHNFDQNKSVKIEFQGTGEHTRRSVTIACRSRKSVLIKRGRSQGISEQPPIVFEYRYGGNLFSTVRPQFSSEGSLRFIGNPELPEPLKGAFFPSSLAIDPLETAIHFSNLSKRHEVADLEARVSAFYPIRDLSLELIHAQPIIHASVAGMTEKLPLGLISNGMNRLITYVVNIADQTGGILIVDEIENGFYHARLEDVWRTLYLCCKYYNVQLFASTHSFECLSALTNVAKGNEPDFNLLRATQEGDRKIIRQFQGDQFLGAVEDNMEVR